MHLIVGLYRLSQGRSSRLNSVFGEISQSPTYEELRACIEVHPDRIREIFDACEWFLDEVVTKGDLLRLFMCIYPEREAKGRTFMLLDYALQLGGSMYSDILRRYLVDTGHASEVFTGFDDGDLMRRASEAIQKSECHPNSGDVGNDIWVLSLDSAAATDPLRHDYAIRVFEPLDRFMPSFARKALRIVFGPTRVSASTRRPRLNFDVLSMEGILGIASAKISFTSKPDIFDKIPAFIPEAFYENASPLLRRVVIWPDRHRIDQALRGNGRILLKSPTGTGKTMLLAEGYPSIIQFPNVAALLRASSSCRALGITHNVWYALCKPGSRRRPPQGVEEDLDEDPEFRMRPDGVPFSILTTAFYVIPLRRKYSKMLVVLDEAETLTEDCALNLLDTRRAGYATIVTSATPEGILGEAKTFMLELTVPTPYVVEVGRVAYADISKRLREFAPGSKTLVICYSEPGCTSLATQLRKSGFQTYAFVAAERRQTEALQEQRIQEAQVILSTNVCRSSVTIPGLTHVLDMQLQYSDVYLPAQGFSQLILCEVTQGMITQAMGRVGRLGDGCYLAITDIPKVQPHEPITFVGGIPSRAARQLDTLKLYETPAALNIGACLQEYVHLRIVRNLTGVQPQPGRPLCLQILDHFIPRGTPGRRTVALFLLFELNSNLPAQINQLRNSDNDLEKEVLRKYNGVSREQDVVGAISRLMNDLISLKLFRQEVGLIENWLPRERYPEEDPHPWMYGSTAAQKAILLSMWHRRCIEDGRFFKGAYRDFSIRIPNSGTSNQAGSAFLALGLSLWDGTTQTRGVLPIGRAVLSWFDEGVIDQDILVPVDLEEFEDIDEVHSPYATWSSADNKGKRHLVLNSHPVHFGHLFQPDDLERLISALKNSTDVCAMVPVEVTTRGSPMSSTFSFSLLNVLGVVAGTGLDLPFLEEFGDDCLALGARLSLLRYIAQREALGLRTKWSATGLSRIRHTQDGNYDGVVALYTERFFSLDFQTQLTTPKPKGLMRLWHAYHPTQLGAAPVYVNDYEGLEIKLSREAPHYLEAAQRGAEEGDILWEKPRRVTEPRLLALKSLQQGAEFGCFVTGKESANEVLKEAEACILLIHPSTMGKPDRLLVDHVGIGYPLIPVHRAQDFLGIAQNTPSFRNVMRRLTRGLSVRREVERHLREQGWTTTELFQKNDRELLAAAKTPWFGVCDDETDDRVTS